MSTLSQLWVQSEYHHPEKIALISAGQQLTYRQVGDRVRKIQAVLLLEWRVQRGDVVALLLPNSIEFVVCYFAVAMAGGIVQPLDERLSAAELQSLLLDSKARFLVVHSSLWNKLKDARNLFEYIEGILAVGSIDGKAERYDEWLSRKGLETITVEVQPDDPAELMYTSGTTGEPKGVMRSHRNVRAASRNARKGFGYNSKDVIAIVMPLSHSSALVSQMLPLLELGGTLVIQDKFETISLLAAVRDERVTCMRAVPAMIKLLLASEDFCADRLPSLRMLINSSAAIDAGLYGALKQRFRQMDVMNSYGLTEASTCTVLDDAAALARPDSVGVPIDGVEMCVVDDEGHRLGDKETGEICVRGEHVFQGYHGKPEATAEVMIDGWLRTGDLGYRDADGFYYLIGRKGDVINCGGRKVIPQEIEQCIRQMPEVADVAVVPLLHRILGEVPRAMVVLRESHAPNHKAIIKHCARSLASHKVPFAVEFVSTLPKNSLGKVLRRQTANQEESPN